MKKNFLFLLLVVMACGCDQEPTDELNEIVVPEYSFLKTIYESLADTCDASFTATNGPGLGDLIIKNKDYTGKYNIFPYLEKWDSDVTLKVRKGENFYILQVTHWYKQKYFYFYKKYLFGKNGFIKEDRFTQYQEYNGRENNFGFFSITDIRDSVAGPLSPGYWEYEYGRTIVTFFGKKMEEPWHGWPHGSHNVPAHVNAFGDKDVVVCYFYRPAPDFAEGQNNLAIIRKNGKVTLYYLHTFLRASGWGIDKKNREIRLISCTGPLIMHDSATEELIIKY